MTLIVLPILIDEVGRGTFYNYSANQDNCYNYNYTGWANYPGKVCDLKSQNPLGPNEVGELRVKTRCQLNGCQGIKPDGIWDDDGWLITGDICYYDDDLCFYVVCRTKEVIRYKSWYVFPSLLEAVLLQHREVQDAMVFGVPHQEDGEHPMAVVVLVPDAENVTPDEIQQFVNSRVDEYQQLRAGVKFVYSLPYTPSAKIKRKQMKDAMLKEMGFVK